LITNAERANVPAVLYDLFAFGPDHRAGIVPTAFVDFGFAPSRLGALPAPSEDGGSLLADGRF
jgi:hypothetical protein